MLIGVCAIRTILLYPSGGEAQRIKLGFFSGKEQSESLFVFDEPTTGMCIFR
jgi:excinuclease UvrABC ATPase subunit